MPVTEGKRYKVGDLKFEGNTVVKARRPAAAVQDRAGRDLQREDDQEGLREGKEVYGTGGYFEFTGYPDLKPRISR